MPRSIDDFPDELVQSIIARNDDKPTLYSLCFVSKRVHGITLPYLYRRFSHHLFQRPQRLHTFLRSILARPGLANACESIEILDPERSIDYWDLGSWHEWAEQNYIPILEAADHLAILTAGTPLHNNSHNQMQYLIRSEEAQAALLICLARNLTYLHIDNPNTVIEAPRFNADHLLMAMLHPQIRENKILQNLRHLVATSSRLEGGQGGFRLGAISTFFRLPQLTTFSGNVCHEPEDGFFDGFDCPERSSTVTTLSFHHSAVCPMALKLMVCACARLEHFSCDWAGTAVGWVEVNFPLLKAALREHRASLRTLTLDTREHFDSWPEHDDGLVPALGSLEDFALLEALDVPASALIGWDEADVASQAAGAALLDVLPPRVRELRVNQVAPRVYEHIAALAEVCNERFPELRRVVLVEMLESIDSGGVEADLRKAFGDWRTDVDFVVEYAAEPAYYLRN